MNLSQTIFIAWKILSYDKVRLLIATGAVGFAILMTYSQIFLFKGVNYSLANFYNIINADVVVLHKNRIAHQRFETFEKNHLAQISAYREEVESVTPVYWGWAHIDSLKSKKLISVTAIGIPPFRDILLIPEINMHIEDLKRKNTIIVSSLSTPPLGNSNVGDLVKINDVHYKIAGRAEIPLTPIEDGNLVMNDSTFRKFFQYQVNPSYGLIKLKKGVNLKKFTKEKLIPLSNDLSFLTPNYLFWRDIIYATKVAKLGVIFCFSMALAILVGALINYQIVQNIIDLNINQFATLEAIGFSSNELTKTIFFQSILLGICSFTVATIFLYPLVVLLRIKTTFLIPISIYEPIFALFLAIFVSSITGFFVSKKVLETDPAELF